ncbi:MAG: oligopeptide transporter, OPT family [Acidobacteriota bacterium]
MDAPKTASLPENAYRPLKQGEVYEPMIPATENPPQGTFRAIVAGLVFCAIFSVAAVYSGLKVGQVMEAAIPISILALGLGKTYPRRSHLLENMIVTGVGGVSASVVAGAIFTLPALYMLKLDPNWFQTTFICVAGGCMGVLFLLPLRRYFVRETHGELPYPEGTAITEVLVTGEKGGSQAALLVQSTVFAGIYDLLITYWGSWREIVNLQWIPVMKMLSEKARMVVHFDAIAFILGLGYVMGLRSSMILCAGGALSNFLLVPLIYYVGQHFPAVAVYPGTKPIAAMAADEIFRSYVRLIGVGAIATAGIFGIIRSLPVLIGSLSIAIKSFRKGQAHDAARTDVDLPVMTLLVGVILSALGVAIFFGTLQTTLAVLIAGLILTLFFSFFFTSVAANAIATTARNPVSGMTMLTIIISSVVLLEFGLSGQTGMFFVMAIAGMVCTALSVSGQTITDLKVGYWLGGTPAVQQKVKFYGVIVAAAASAFTIWMLPVAGYYFGEGPAGAPSTRILPSPQAAIMKTLVENFMNQQPVAYRLLGVGAALAVVLEMLKVPALTFALGMYLPLELNTPALVGGYLHHLVTTRSERRGGESGRAMRERGIVVASGMMAGGAIGGVFGVLLRLLPEGWLSPSFTALALADPEKSFVPWAAVDWATESIALIGFGVLCGYIWVKARGPR